MVLYERRTAYIAELCISCSLPLLLSLMSDVTMSVQLDNRQSIIDYCRSYAEDQLIGGTKYGNQVVKLPGCDLVVKFGR